MVGAWGAIGTDTPFKIVKIVSGYLAQIIFKYSEVYLNCNRKTPRSISQGRVPVYKLVDPIKKSFKVQPFVGLLA